MAGKAFKGDNETPKSYRLVTAFAEGRRAMYTGTGTNPHAVGTEEYESWQDGYNYSRRHNPGELDNCAEPVSTYCSVVNVVDVDAVDVESELILNGLVIGTVTGVSGDVVSQDPAANTRVLKGTAVDVTLEV